MPAAWNFGFVKWFISFTCATAILKEDCINYMQNCINNPDIIGTYDAKKMRNLTLEDRAYDCHDWEIDQRKPGLSPKQFAN